MPPRSSDDCGAMGVGICEYPSQLNASAALGFERSGPEDVDGGCYSATTTALPPTTVAVGVSPGLRDADLTAGRENEEMRSLPPPQERGLQPLHPTGQCDEDGPPVSCSSSTLGDDLILCRLSSLLPPAPAAAGEESSSSSSSSSSSRSRGSKGKSRRPPLVRKVSASDTDYSSGTISSSDDDNDAGEGSDKGGGGSRRRGLRPRLPPAFSLIPADAAVVLPTILRHPDDCNASSPNDLDDDEYANHRQHDDHGSTYSSGPVRSLLRAVGIDEVESLDPTHGGPTAGQCQFACVASALSRSYGTDPTLALRPGYRPDLELRRLALHTIRMNPDLYRAFLTVAGGRTRKQNGSAGEGVDLDAYLRSMSNPSCDGDAVTLQALCDALKMSVRIVKPVGADAYDEERQNERLYGSCSSSASASDEESDCDETSSTTSASSISSSDSALSWSDNPYSSSSIHRAHGHHHHHSSEQRGLKRQRLYVSQEIRPRRLPRIDSRIRDVQKVARGRLIWLSHIGDEAHYRYLRPLTSGSSSSLDNESSLPVNELGSGCSRSGEDPSNNCPQGPVNASEAALARRSRLLRHRRLDDLCAREDGFVRPVYGTTDRDRFSANAKFDVVSDDKLRMLRTTLSEEPGSGPRCGLCFVGLLGDDSGSGSGPSSSSSSSSSSPSPLSVSPSGCNHDFCLDCIATWSTSVSSDCPACGCRFLDLVDSKERVVKVAAATTVEDGSSTGIDESSDGGEQQRALALPLQMVRPPPSLPESFGLDEAIEVQRNGEALAVSALNRQLLIELGKDGGLAGAGVTAAASSGEGGASHRTLLRLLSQLAAMVEGPHLPDLLEANVLSVLRLLLTPADGPRNGRSGGGSSASVRSYPVGVSVSGRQQLHVLNPEMFRLVILVLEGINLHCSDGGGGNEPLLPSSTSSPGRRPAAAASLTTAMLRQSLDLPKLLLWYASCPTLRASARYRDGLDRARGVLRCWSRRHCLSIVEALQRNNGLMKSSSSEKKKRSAAASASGPGRHQGGKRPAASSAPSGRPKAKKRKAPASSSTSAAPTSPSKKRLPLASTKRKLKKTPSPPPARLSPRPKPRILIRRAAGKRQVRPVACVNISEDDWSSRMYRS